MQNVFVDGVNRVLSAIKGNTYSHVYFIACGGSNALMYPSQFMIDQNSKTLSAEYLNSNEFIYRHPAALGKDSIVILCSQEGKTPETVAAAAFARKAGATTITFAMRDNTPIQEAGGEFFIKYGYYETCDPVETSYGLMFLLTAGIIENQEGGTLYEDMLDSLEKLKLIMAREKTAFVPFAQNFAESCKDAKNIYSTASGCDFSQAYVLCNCYLMEMQWMNAIPIHAGEFFHGPFEIIEKDSPVVAMVGMDSTRFLEERAVKFLKKYTDKVFVLDMGKVDYGDMKANCVGYASTLILNNLCRMLMHALADVRHHDLDIRRYMHIVEY